ncbi:ATP-binding cassette domain-containing protein [bacterium]|nr:ATP-binding cassette domain-containing protein [bacterium]
MVNSAKGGGGLSAAQSGPIELDLTDPVIRLQDVHLTMPGKSMPVNILRGVNLEVKRGETLAVVGPSGSGKTSLMMIMAGLERPTSGSVTVAGMDMVGANEDRLALFRQRAMGIVFQQFHLIPTMTALENVLVPLELLGRDNARERASELLARVGLDRRFDHFPSQLSGGEQQRVALARAFAAEPPILLADEPTGNLDLDTGTLVIEQLSDLQQQHNTTLVLITHNVHLANACERKVIIQDGMLFDSAAAEAMYEAA